MSFCWKACAFAVLLAIGIFAHAAPPTVVPSPGYDARLQEQRAAAAAKTTEPAAIPVTPRRHKKPRN